MSSLPTPDDIRDALGSPFVALYWPMILGGIGMFLALIAGSRKFALFLISLAVLVQAWHLGLIGGK